jgi:hypothetical protein
MKMDNIIYWVAVVLFLISTGILALVGFYVLIGILFSGWKVGISDARKMFTKKIF